MNWLDVVRLSNCMGKYVCIAWTAESAAGFVNQKFGCCVEMALQVRVPSQNHRMTEVGKDLWRPSCPTPAQGGPLWTGCSGPCPGNLRRSPERRLHSLSGKLVPVLWHSHSTEVFPDSQKEPHVPVCAHCLLPHTGHLLEEPDSIFSSASLQVFTTYSDELSVLLLAEQSQLSQKSCCSPLTVMVALCWTLPSMSKSLLHWGGLKLDTGLRVGVQLQYPRHAVTLVTVFMPNMQGQYTYLSPLQKEGICVML